MLARQAFCLGATSPALGHGPLPYLHGSIVTENLCSGCPHPWGQHGRHFPDEQNLRGVVGCHFRDSVTDERGTDKAHMTESLEQGGQRSAADRKVSLSALLRPVSPCQSQLLKAVGVGRLQLLLCDSWGICRVSSLPTCLRAVLLVSDLDLKI